MLLNFYVMKQSKEKRWYVFYTCPRAEKKVNEYLQSIGYEVFLPLKVELKIWKNRQKKIIEKPLFSSYIFVNTFQFEIFKINKVRGICNCVTCAGVPAVISNNDIMSLKIMQNMNAVVVGSTTLLVGDKVRVINGPLCGYEGVLTAIKGVNKFGINISCVNLAAIVDLDILDIEKL